MSAEPAESTTLPRVPLGRNGLEVTRLCLGAAQLGELRSEETGQAMLEAAWAGGIRSFDVAPLYGCGLAERRLGAFLAAKPRDCFVLSTKVGRLLVPKGGAPDPSLPSENNLQPVFDYSRDGVHASLEASLERLGLDRVDITLIHDPDDHFVEAMHDAYPALEELRSAGVVRAIGLGMNQAEMLTRFVSDTDVDCVLVAGRYSLLDNRASRALLPAAAAPLSPPMRRGTLSSTAASSPTRTPARPTTIAPQHHSLRRASQRCERSPTPTMFRSLEPRSTFRCATRP